MGWLRRILGVSKIHRLHDEFIRSKLDKKETLISRTQKKRLRWFGHLERMKESHLPQRMLHCHIEGNRSRGRQEKTWMDNIKEDLKTKNMNIRTATDLVRDRTRWNNLVQTHRQPS